MSSRNSWDVNLAGAGRAKWKDVGDKLAESLPRSQRGLIGQGRTLTFTE